MKKQLIKEAKRLQELAGIQNEIKLINNKDLKLIAFIEDDDDSMIILNITSEIFKDIDVYGHIDKEEDPENVIIEFLFDTNEEDSNIEKKQMEKIIQLLQKFKYDYELLYPNGSLEDGGDLVYVIVPKKYFKIIK